MPTCKLCSKDKHQSEFDQPEICAACAKEHCLLPASEPLRPRIPCVRCNGTELVRCHALRDRAATGSDYVAPYLAPLAATFAHKVDQTFWAGREERKPHYTEPVGIFEAYICRSCGYTELYTRAPSEIPLGPEYATELFDVGGEGPYR